MSESYRSMTFHLTLHNGRLVEKPVTPHLSPERFAGFLDGRLTPSERARAVQHFAECAACRKEMTDLRGVIDSASTPRHRVWAVTGAALAAAVAFAVVLPRITSDSAPVVATHDAPGVRAGDGPSAIVMSEPPDSSPVSPPVRLVWHSAGPNAAYLIVVQDSTGAELFRVSPTDTSLTIPAHVRMQSGARYYWSVDASLRDGTSARSGARSFMMR